ncbi:MAG: hypothetical protein H6R10_3177 [Rhodocyclaceae bacterium]|nr:hypothetical protein [Rhodocyclaceae bacterium]
MRYGPYEIETVVDWIELEIQLPESERSNFWTVQRHLREALHLPPDAKPGIDPMDAIDTGAASVFQFRVQDPKMPHLNQAMASLVERFNIEAVRVVAIEIAFDTYRHGASAEDLAQIVANRYRFSTEPPADYWHLYRKPGEEPIKVSDLGRFSDLVRYLKAEWQITDCEARSNPEIRYHGYVKMWDNGQALEDPSDWRARWEITLRGGKLPCKTLQELKRFKFIKLAPLFKFRRLRDDMSLMRRHTLETWWFLPLGMRGRYRRPNRSMKGRLYSGVSKYRDSTVADELNESIRDCLNKLTRQWRGAK